MQVYYHDIFTFPLPREHRFPIGKYARVRDRLLSAGILNAEELIIPEAASDAQLSLVHNREYIEKINTGNLTPQETRRLGFPWSPGLVERSRRSVGSTIAAGRTAFAEGISINLAGGTHHAHPAHGEGFCVFNDVAVAARLSQLEGYATRVVILDCDVHQGDGTAMIFSDDPTVFTMSIHGEKNFPFRKQKSDLDIALADGTEDREYLAALDYGVKKALDSAEADLAIYLAGADPFAGDRLGRLSLTKEGLAARDKFVFKICFERRIPIVVTMGGGYANDIQDIVDIHVRTVQEAVHYHKRMNK